MVFLLEQTECIKTVFKKFLNLFFIEITLVYVLSHFSSV